MTTTDTPQVETTAAAGAPTVREYDIPASLAPDASAKVIKVNRRLAKLGLPPYHLDVTDTGDVRPVYDTTTCRTVVDGVPCRIEMGRAVPCDILYWAAYVHVTITGAIPRLADWEPVAVLTRDQDGPVITRVWPGLATEPDLTRFRSTDAACEQCNTRRWRKDTYVVRNTETGELRQVGGNCLTAFTGVRVTIPTWLTSGDGFDEMGTWAAGAGDYRLPTAEVIRWSVAAVAEFGWVSKTQSKDSMGRLGATADLVAVLVGRPTPEAAQLRRALTPRYDTATTRADQVRAHAITLADRETGEYPANLSAVAAHDWVSPRNLPLLVSAVSSLARHEEREIKRSLACDSAWQGQPGQRLDLTLTVVARHDYDNAYGMRSIIAMTDGGGNRFKWFTDLRGDWAAGDIVTLRGTVKAHGEYQNVKETVLTRCTVANHLAAVDVKDNAFAITNTY